MLYVSFVCVGVCVRKGCSAARIIKLKRVGRMKRKKQPSFVDVPDNGLLCVGLGNFWMDFAGEGPF